MLGAPSPRSRTVHFPQKGRGREWRQLIPGATGKLSLSTPHPPRDGAPEFRPHTLGCLAPVEGVQPKAGVTGRLRFRKGPPWGSESAHMVPCAVACGRAASPGCPLTWGSMLACSLGAGVSGGGMVMDRLGGFRLCRRLLDPEEMLSPFLSSEAMLGERGQGRWNGNREGGAVVLRGGRTGGATGTVQGVRVEPGQAARTENPLQKVCSHLTLDTDPRSRVNPGWVGSGGMVYFCLSFAFQASRGPKGPQPATLLHFWCLSFRQGPHPDRNPRARDVTQGPLVSLARARLGAQRQLPRPKSSASVPGAGLGEDGAKAPG